MLSAKVRLKARLRCPVKKLRQNVSALYEVRFTVLLLSPLTPHAMSAQPSEHLIEHFVIDLPAGDAASFAGFAAVVSPMFELIPVHGDQPFHAHVAATCLPEIYLTRTVASASRYERHHRTIAQSGTDAVVVLVYLSTGFSIELDGRCEQVDAQDLVFLDLCKPVSIQAERVDNISLVVSRQKLEALGVPIRDVHGLVLKSGVTKELLLSHLRACVQVGARLAAADAQAVSDVTAQLVAACWHGRSRRTVVESSRAGLASLVDAKAFIESQLANPALGPAMVQEAFNLSRATLYRMFEPVGGVAAYILARRMHRAFQLITVPNADRPRIKQLALAVGFEHPSAFSRAFRKHFGLSPQEVRTRQKFPTEPSARPWRVPSQAVSLVAHALESPGLNDAPQEPGAIEPMARVPMGPV